MEKKKFDLNTVLGVLLIGGIILWMMYRQPSPKEVEAEKARIEQIEEAKKAKDTIEVEEIVAVTPAQINAVNGSDSLAMEGLKNRLGSFSYSGTLTSATEGTTVVENDVLQLTVSNKGGYIVEAKLKD